RHRPRPRRARRHRARTVGGPRLMAPTRPPRARTIAAWVASLTAAAVFVTGAVIAQGYDAEDLPAVETTVWVARDASGGQYAKVNTDIAEIAAVRTAQ